MNDKNLPALSFNGEIVRDRGERLNLTDMWRAAGADDSRRPSKWLEIDATREFVEYVASAQNVRQGDIIVGERGRNGSTWAHWQVGLAYAKYLSPEFHAWVNEVVRERMVGKPQPAYEFPAGQFGGIVKSVVSPRFEGVHEDVAALRDTVTELRNRVDALMLAADARIAVAEYISVRAILDRAKAVSRKRRSLQARLYYAMRERALLKGVALRRCPHSAKWLFPIDFANACMVEFGNEWVLEHNGVVGGQGVLQFPKRRRSAVPVDEVTA